MEYRILVAIYIKDHYFLPVQYFLEGNILLVLRTKLIVALLFNLAWFYFVPGYSQVKDIAEIKNLVQTFKKDERGPYQAIRWFCPDGRVLPPKERCNQPGSIQHALHKDAVTKISRDWGIYLGQILAGTPFTDFLDAANQNSRLKQYQLEKYLQAVDDGWIIRRARYYRGAIQAEDEEDWGLRFLTSLAASDDILITQFFLLRQAAKDIPHNANDDRWQSIRALSKTIGDSLPSFMNLRIKLHGQPGPEDVQAVKDFRTRNFTTIPAKINAILETLIKDLEIAYRPFNLNSLNPYLAKLSPDSPIAAKIKKLMQDYRISATDGAAQSGEKCRDIAELLLTIRRHILAITRPANRLAMIDLSNEMERLLFRTVNDWRAETIGELLRKSYTLSQAAAGCGYIETWEWETIEPLLKIDASINQIALEKCLEKADYSRRVVEWGSGMIRANYDPVISLFLYFEPLAAGFIDDRVRASILLPLGDIAGELSEFTARESGTSNRVMNIRNQGQIQGLNPGFALGPLEVISGSPEAVAFSAKKIYLLQHAPADMKPVAGIATVSEGNLVSHVQLLARNLGIPNAVFSAQNLTDLLPYSGQTVFYAVSPRGAVIMKLASEMTAEEKALVDEEKRPDDRITVPVEKIDLKQTGLVSLRKLRTADSGRLCGPKAANLGELKTMFPDKVVEGFAIPFAIFYRHMEQPMPGSNATYWQFLQTTFRQAERERKNGVNEEEVERFTLERLAQLRQAIKQIPLLAGFKAQLHLAFRDNFGVEIGQQTVFIRSDTNMEDLKEFTGAGLNLTVFNVAEAEKIFQGIRDVWASPYSERSYRWRQKYLLNPENVFPSILILPTVNVDKSGVMITTGVLTADPRDITIAFSRGPGGAVEGQAAESYLLRHDGQDLLLSPAREKKYNVLPATGGTQKGFSHFNRPLLAAKDLEELRDVSKEIQNKLLKTPGIESAGPWDIELGFLDDKIWLFQVRPFVENKRAKSSMYLLKLDPEMPKGKKIALGEKTAS